MLPIIGRELAISSRRPSLYLIRSGFVSLLLLLSALLVWRLDRFAEPGRAGMAIFNVASGLLFLYAIASGTLLTADCLSAERREGTLPLLFLTDLKPIQVVFGKMICSSAHGLVLFLSVFPALSLGFLFGGIATYPVFMSLIVLSSSLVVSLELGVFVSSRSLIERKARLGTFLAVGMWLIAPLILEHLILGRSFLEGFNHPENITLGFLSPLAQALWVDDVNYFVPEKIILGTVANQLIGYLLLRQAARNVWDCEPQNGRQSIRNSKQEISRSESQRPYRSRLLGQAPTKWLAARQPLKRVMGLILSLLILVLATLAADFAPLLPFRMSLPYSEFTNARMLMLLAGVWVIFVFFKSWAFFEVYQRSAEDLRTGALELLLSTPLSVGEMSSGFHRALLYFLLPSLALVFLWLGASLLFATTLVSSEELNDSVICSVILLLAGFADLWALSWIGLWEGARSRSMLLACLRTWVKMLVAPVLGALLFLKLPRVIWLYLPPHFPELQTFESCVLPAYFVLSAFWGIKIGRTARNSYLLRLRAAAGERFKVQSLPMHRRLRTWLNTMICAIGGMPLKFFPWAKSHPRCRTLLLTVLLLLVFQQFLVRHLDQRVARRIQEIHLSGYSTNYSLSHDLRTQAVAKAWISSSTRLKDMRARLRRVDTGPVLERFFRQQWNPAAPLPPEILNVLNVQLDPNDRFLCMCATWLRPIGWARNRAGWIIQTCFQVRLRQLRSSTSWCGEGWWQSRIKIWTRRWIWLNKYLGSRASIFVPTPKKVWLGCLKRMSK